MGGSREFRAEEHSNQFHSIIAMAIWLGAIHFNVALVLCSLIFLPPSLSLMYIHLSLYLSLFAVTSLKFKLFEILCFSQGLGLALSVYLYPNRSS